MLGNTSHLEATCADGKPAWLQRMPDNSKMQSWGRYEPRRSRRSRGTVLGCVNKTRIADKHGTFTKNATRHVYVHGKD